MKTILILTGIVFLYSCVTHKGLITSTNSSSTSQKLVYKDIAVGYSKTSYFFCIGGFNKDMLINDAKRNLLMSYPLKPNQSFENLTLDVKSTIIGPYKKTEAIILADVVEHEISSGILYDENYSNILFKNKVKENNFISLNEKVIFFKDYASFVGTVVKFNKRKATIFYVDQQGDFRLENINYQFIYKYSNTDSLEKRIGFKINEKVNILSISINGMYHANLEGTIIALNNKFALIISKYGKHTIAISNLAIIEKQ